MRVTQADATTIRSAIKLFDTPERRQQYRDGNYRNAPAQNLDARYRWDLLWLAVDELRHDGDKLKDVVYGGGYNNEHLDTALRRIVPSLDVPRLHGAGHAA